MKPKYIPPRHLATEIACAHRRLIDAIELNLTREQRNSVSERTLKDLMSAGFEQYEAIQILAIVETPRIKCGYCGKGQAVTRASGAFCAQCAEDQKTYSSKPHPAS